MPDAAPLREGLRQAIERRSSAQAVVDKAAEFVTKAEASLAAARSELARIALYEKDRERELERAIRNGASPPEDAETADKGKAHGRSMPANAL